MEIFLSVTEQNSWLLSNLIKAEIVNSVLDDSASYARIKILKYNLDGS